LAESEKDMSPSQASDKPLNGEDSIATIEEIDPLAVGTTDHLIVAPNQIPVI
jgi:hypothetical protein